MTDPIKPDVEAFDAFLCRAWGETDLPSAELVEGWDGVRRFMVREWLGAEDATDYDGTVTLDRLKADYDEHIEDERGDLYEIEFEIGGVSIERVVGFRPVREPVAWANFRHDPPSYVPFRSREAAQRSVDQSEISATQEGPYSVAPLYP